MPTTDPARRVVATGLGAVTPIGNTAEAYWQGLISGVSGVGPITLFDPVGLDVRIAAEVKDFDPTIAMDRKMARRMSRFIHLAMAAATEAVNNSGIDFASYTPEQLDRVAVVINTGGGGLEQVLEGTRVLAEKGPGQVSPFAIPALSGSMSACQISMKYGTTGPVITQVAACASGVISFIDGWRMIQSGEADVCIVGGTEGALVPIAFAALGNMGALSRRNDDPTHASRPFDRERDGFVFGEDVGVLMVEVLRKRGVVVMGCMEVNVKMIRGLGGVRDGVGEPVDEGLGSAGQVVGYTLVEDVLLVGEEDGTRFLEARLICRRGEADFDSAVENIVGNLLHSA